MTLSSRDIELLDSLSETLHKMTRGEVTAPLKISVTAEDNEVCQVVSYFNDFISAYNEFSEYIFSISRGELGHELPAANKLFVVQALKSLQSNLRHLTWKTQRIAGGDFAQRVDFMGDFSASFNKMTADLKSSFARIESQKLELEKLSAMKDEFLAVAGHDLRTPFTAILGFCGLLLADKTLGNEQREMVRIINYSAETQLEYVNDILDVMKLEAGEIKLKLRPADIETLILECVEGLRRLVESKGIKLLVLNSLPESFPEIEIDAPKIKQIMNNLISNSMKFTEPGKKITVSCFINASSEVEIHVMDEGVGIAERSMPELFTRYRQFRSAGTGGEKGTGLGLFICKTFVEAHGGVIGAKSVVGSGSDFYFRLPVRRHEIAAGDNEKNPGGRTEIALDEIHIGARRASQAILIVEDDPALRKLIAKMIAIRNCGVPHFADTGMDALKMLETEKIDFIFMDIQLPDMTGFETAAAIRSAWKQIERRIPIIALTGFSGPDMNKKLAESGIDGILIKPVSVDKLVESIHKYSIT